MPVSTVNGGHHRQGVSLFRRRNLLSDSLVRAMPVVVAGVAAQDALEVGFVHDQLVVEALRSHGAHEPFGEGVRVRSPKGGVWRISAPSARNALSKLPTYLVSRSRTRNLVEISWSARSLVTFLACWVTHPPLG